MKDEYVALLKRYKFVTKEAPVLLLMHIKTYFLNLLPTMSDGVRHERMHFSYKGYNDFKRRGWAGLRWRKGDNT